MMDWQAYEAPLRVGIFASVFLILAMLEFFIPRKRRVKPRLTRWVSNFGMLLIANLVMRLVIPLLAVGVALEMQTRGIGLFNWLDWLIWLEVTVAVIALDFAIWAQHLVMHHVPALWALHKVHHADEDLDASSGIRFHPIEQFLSLGFKMLVIAGLGASPLAVFLFEVILNACAMFNHASIRLPLGADRVLRRWLVTPDMHRVHHSIYQRETNSNYGFCLSVWDRLFHTYTDQPLDGHDAMKLGLDKKPGGNTAGLVWGLWLPFRRNPSGD